MTMRMLPIIAAASLTFASGAAYAIGGGSSGFSWNQVAADTSARAWAAEGVCFPGGWFSWGVPCAALQPPVHPYGAHRRRHNHKFD